MSNHIYDFKSVNLNFGVKINHLLEEMHNLLKV